MGKRITLNFLIKEIAAAATAAKSLQSCPTLLDPMDCSPPGSSVHGIFKARILEWVAIAFHTKNKILGYPGFNAVY